MDVVSDCTTCQWCPTVLLVIVLFCGEGKGQKQGTGRPTARGAQHMNEVRATLILFLTRSGQLLLVLCHFFLVLGGVRILHAPDSVL
jgi:hypothetical protein